MNARGQRLTSCTCAVFVVLLFSVPQCATAQGPPIDPFGRPAASKPEEDRSKWSIKEQGAAIAHARRIVGLPRNPSLPATAELITVVQDNTPYLSEQVVGRPIWHVVVEKCRIVLPSGANFLDDAYERTFDILIDPRNGALLRISSRLPDGLPALPREASATLATEQLMNRGPERYHAFIEGAPAITFYEALVGLIQSGDNPLQSKQLVGQYVLWSMLDREPKPAWAVTLNGIPPFEAAYPGVAVEARNHMRYIVDPETGKWICGTTTPQPEINPTEPDAARDAPEKE